MALDNRAALLAALRGAHWIIKDAARALGCSRQAIYDAMRRHDIERQPPDPEAWDEALRTRVWAARRRTA